MGKFIVKAIIAVVAFMLMISLVKFLHPYLIATAVLLWLVTFLSFLYINGKGLAVVNNNKHIAAGFDWLLAMRSASDQEELIIPPKVRDPKQVLKEALYYLEQGIHGQQQVKEQINDIFSKLGNSTHTGLRALSPSDGSIILAKGPHGSGKTLVISQFFSLLYGAEVLDSEMVIEVDRLDFSVGRDPLDVLYGLMNSNGCGTVIIHDADFLVENGSETISGYSIGTAIARIAKNDPHRLLIVLELSDKAANRMENDPDHKKWLDKLGIFEFDFEQLNIDSLIKVLDDYLQDEGFSIAAEALNKMKRLVQDIMDAEPNNFKNAHAMRHLSESLIRSYSRNDSDDKVITDTFLSDYIAAQ